jgi:hypothetical protein
MIPGHQLPGYQMAINHRIEEHLLRKNKEQTSVEATSEVRYVEHVIDTPISQLILGLEDPSSLSPYGKWI